MTEPRHGRLWGRALGAALAAAVAGSAVAEEPVPPKRPSMNLFGVTGAIDLPTADMQPDGELSLTAGYFNGFLRNTLTFQFLPGVEAAFRYSILEGIGRDGNPDLFDRSFDVKFRLIEETEHWPSLAVGLQDFLGTGVYSGEYVALTKGFDVGEVGEFRFTGGIGWGRFAREGCFPNPMRGISDRFETRSSNTGEGGQLSFGDWFSGENVGCFAALEWLTPLDGLTAKVEYSTDTYGRENTFDPGIPVNFGLDYQVNESIQVGAYYMYGETFGVRVSLSGNPFRPGTDADDTQGPLPVLPRRPLPNGAEIAGLGETRVLLSGAPTRADFNIDRLESVVIHTRLGSVRWAEAVVTDGDPVCPEAIAFQIDAEYGVIDVVTFSRPNGNVVCTIALRPEGEHAVRLTSRLADHYPTDWYDQPEERQRVVEALTAELDADSIGLIGIELAPRRVSVYVENELYFAMPRALGRTVRALTRTMPASVEIFEVSPLQLSVPVATVIFKRSDLEDQVERPDAALKTWSTAEVVDARPVNISRIEANNDIFPRFSWGISPDVPVNMFDPDQPLRADLQIEAHAGVEFFPGFSINGGINQRIIGQLDDIDRPAASSLPHVRSDFARYLRDGNPGINRLTADYITKFTPEIYARASVGMLEWMYGGVSGEVLWKPVDQSWGLGLELSYVRQRDYDQLFTFLDYDVVTGHASVYWNTGFYGLTAQVDAGRYLAGDWGATFSLSRRFTNGWEVGGFFTLTDVPFDEFGEGSFDKGIYLTIPLNWFVPFETGSSYSTVLRPLTRDGGQKLNAPNHLWPVAQNSDRGALRAHWEEFWE